MQQAQHKRVLDLGMNVNLTFFEAGFALQLNPFEKNPPSNLLTKILNQTVALAKEAERMGYERCWLGQHDELRGAWGNPEPLISHIASQTKSLRVGSAGVPFKYLNPIEIAQNYRLLATLFPKRIDLGLSHGRLSINAAAELQRTRKIKITLKEENRKFHDTVAFVRNEIAKSHRYYGACAIPLQSEIPDIWSLGGYSGLKKTMTFNTNLAISLYHSGEEEKHLYIAKQFNSWRQANEQAQGLKLCVLVGVLCAETTLKACSAFADGFVPLVHLNVIGNPKECAQKLLELAKKYGTKNLALCHLTHDYRKKLNSMRLISAALG